MFSRHLMWIGLLCATLLAGCTLPFRPAPKEAEPPLPVSTPAIPPAEPFRVLLPGQDLQLQVTVTDQGAQPVVILEEWIRDESQRALLTTYAGAPFVRWEWNDEGLWRLDPRGGGALLRYLPPTLEEGALWRQPSGDEAVWFHLAKQATPCKAGTESTDCWVLEVLNRGELLTYTFARGVGPIAVKAENYAKPADSFTKQLVEVRPSQLSSEQRAEFIAKLPPSGATAAPIQTATLEQFEAARAAMQKP